jgi:hypothetical protein
MGASWILSDLGSETLLQSLDFGMRIADLEYGVFWPLRGAGRQSNLSAVKEIASLRSQ